MSLCADLRRLDAPHQPPPVRRVDSKAAVTIIGRGYSEAVKYEAAQRWARRINGKVEAEVLKIGCCSSEGAARQSAFPHTTTPSHLA
eukprot:366045-Chlamydomonas_euryale.AAC.5